MSLGMEVDLGPDDAATLCFRDEKSDCRDLSQSSTTYFDPTSTHSLVLYSFLGDRL